MANSLAENFQVSGETKWATRLNIHDYFKEEAFLSEDDFSPSAESYADAVSEGDESGPAEGSTMLLC